MNAALVTGSVPAVAILDVALVAVLSTLAAKALTARDRPGATPAGLLFLVLAGVCGAVTLARVGLVAVDAAVFAVFVGWLAGTGLWTAFVFDYAARGPALTPRWAAALAGFVGAVGLVTGTVEVLEGNVGLLAQLALSTGQTTVVGLGAFGSFLLVHSAVADGDPPLGQAALLAAGGLGTTVLVFSVATVSQGTASIPAAISGYLGVTVGTFAAAVVRYRPFEDAPGAGYLGREAILGETSEGVVVVDREGRVVDANRAAERTFGVSLSAVAGRPVREFVGVDPESASEDPVDIETPRGRRTFDVRRSSLTTETGDAVGASYLFEDVTERRLQRQRLEVLDRVMRHNLRNDLDAMRGFAETLAEGSVGDERVARRIRSTATDLADLGATVERAERITERDGPTLERVDVGAAVSDVADAQAASAPDCQLAVDTPDGPATVCTDPAVLRAALVELLDASLDHAACDGSGVAVAVTGEDDGVHVGIDLDGPGIPERERAVVAEGEETPLRHGTGVGLWLASWAATRLGGDLAFDDDGRHVDLRVPDRTADGRDRDGRNS